MSLKEQLQDDLSAAMRAGDTERRDILRLLMAAIKQEEVDSGRELDDADVQAILNKQAKQRRESIADAERAGRADLVEAEQAELEMIQAYLPDMMDREEIEAIAAPLIAEMGVTDMKGMGQVMGRLMPQLQGRAEGHMVSAVVRDLLQQRSTG